MATAKKKTAKTAPQESKSDKFKRLAEMRTTKAINAIRGIGRLTNRNNYEYTAEQATKICDALKAEVVSIYDAFTNTKEVKKEGFKL